MTKIKCYHGTTEENYNNILKGINKDVPIWYCSDDPMLYVFPENKKEEDDDGNDELIRRAFESAVISAALLGHKKIVVLEFVFDVDKLEDDYSCENMESSASCIHIQDVNLKKDLKNVYISSSYNPELRPFYISGLINNKHLNLSVLDDNIMEAAKLLHENNIYLEELMYFDWEQQ